MTFDDDVKRAIPSLVNVVASASDNQQAEESYNVRKFELPNPAGKSGGACTTAFLKQQYIASTENNGVGWMEMLQNMHTLLKGLGFAQTPTLSSSRKIKSSTPMQIVPPGSGKRRALLIGINYVGQTGELQSCHNDCQNVREFLKSVHSFRDEEMMVLMDDGMHSPPTKENIENGFILLTKYSQPGDVVFVSFSGHGGRTKDLDGDEADGWDSTIFPVDFNTTGQIVDDDILKMLVKPMPAGVTTTVLIDCCHSGSVVDLPYIYAAGDSKMTRDDGFNMEIVTESVRPAPRGPRKREKQSKTKRASSGTNAAGACTPTTEKAPDLTVDAIDLSTTQFEKVTSHSVDSVSVTPGSIKATKPAKVKVEKSSVVPVTVPKNATSSSTKPSWSTKKEDATTPSNTKATEAKVPKTTSVYRTPAVEPSRKVKPVSGIIDKTNVFKSEPKPLLALKKTRLQVVGNTGCTSLSTSTLSKAEELRQARRLRDEAERLREAS